MCSGEILLHAHKQTDPRMFREALLIMNNLRQQENRQMMFYSYSEITHSSEMNELRYQYKWRKITEK